MFGLDLWSESQEDYILELVRFGAGELHVVASITGGVAAQVGVGRAGVPCVEPPLRLRARSVEEHAPGPNGSMSSAGGSVSQVPECCSGRGARNIWEQC